MHENEISKIIFDWSWSIDISIDVWVVFLSSPFCQFPVGHTVQTNKQGQLNFIANNGT